MKRVAVLLVFIIFIIPCAHAQNSVDAYVNVNMVTVYTLPKTSSGVLGKLAFGNGVTVTALNDGWAQITNGKKVGYCLADALTKSNPNKLSLSLTVVKDDTAVRAKPSAGSKLLGRLSSGAALKVVALTEDCNWFRVKSGSKFGYVKTNALAGGTRMFLTIQDLAVQDMNGKDRGIISFGQSVYRLAKNDSIWLVQNTSGKVGYVNAQSDYFSATDPNTLSETRYAVCDGVRLFKKGVATKANVVKTLSKGDSVTVVALDAGNNGLCRVKYGDGYAYAITAQLDTVKSEALITLKAQGGLSVYAGALFKSTTVATLTNGETVTLVSLSGARAKIITGNGITGYCLASGLER